MMLVSPISLVGGLSFQRFNKRRPSKKKTKKQQGILTVSPIILSYFGNLKKSCVKSTNLSAAGDTLLEPILGCANKFSHLSGVADVDALYFTGIFFDPYMADIVKRT